MLGLFFSHHFAMLSEDFKFFDFFWSFSIPTISENILFSDVLRGYKKRPGAKKCLQKRSLKNDELIGNIAVKTKEKHDNQMLNPLRRYVVKWSDTL